MYSPGVTRWSVIRPGSRMGSDLGSLFGGCSWWLGAGELVCLPGVARVSLGRPGSWIGSLLGILIPQKAVVSLPVVPALLLHEHPKCVTLRMKPAAVTLDTAPVLSVPEARSAGLAGRIRSSLPPSPSHVLKCLPKEDASVLLCRGPTQLAIGFRRHMGRAINA